MRESLRFGLTCSRRIAGSGSASTSTSKKTSSAAIAMIHAPRFRLVWPRWFQKLEIGQAENMADCTIHPSAAAHPPTSSMAGRRETDQDGGDRPADERREHRVGDAAEPRHGEDAAVQEHGGDLDHAVGQVDEDEVRVDVLRGLLSDTPRPAVASKRTLCTATASAGERRVISWPTPPCVTA